MCPWCRLVRGLEGVGRGRYRPDVSLVSAREGLDPSLFASVFHPHESPRVDRDVGRHSIFLVSSVLLVSTDATD